MAPLSLKIILDEGAVTRTVKFESSTKVADAYAIIREKILTPDDGKEYALFLTSADNDRSGIWLEAHRPLDYYMLRNGDTLLYLNKYRILRIKMLDGSVKTLQVDESKNIGELMLFICGKIGITNHDEYGLCQEEAMQQNEAKENKGPATGTLTLKRKAQQRERDAKIDQLSKKLNTDDNVDWLDQHKTLREIGVDATETLLLKRRLFFSDRNVDSRDPVQLNLLYVQTRDAILNGRHPVTEDQAADCKQRWVHIRDVHRRILRKLMKDPCVKMKMYKYHHELEFMRSFYKELGVPVYDNEFCDNNDDDGEDDEDHPREDPIADDAADDAADSDELDKPIVKRRRGRGRLYKTDKKMKVERVQLYSRRAEEEEVILEKNVSVEDVVQTQLDPKNPVDAFLLSIGATLKNFTPYHLNLAKSEIFSVVQQHEMQQIVQEPQEHCESKISTSNHDHMYSS